MPDAAYLIAGLIIGGAAAWLFAKARLEGRARAAEALASDRERQIANKEAELGKVRTELISEKESRVSAETKYQEAEKNLLEQKALLESMKAELSDTFAALSSAALKSSSEDFLRLASVYLGTVTADTKGKLGEHHAAMDGLIKPLQETLKRYEEQIHDIEVKRKQEYTSLDEQIKMLFTSNTSLQRETGNLVSALRKPHIRGRWGEVTLRNVVELAGMSPHCDFTEQVSVETETGRLRPDMVIHLPGGHDIVVDSKVSLEALLDASSAQTEDAKKEAMKRHTQHVKEQVNRLSSKSYWSQFSKSPEFAVLFMAESAMVPALEAEPAIIEDSLSKKILIATPTTLFPLLTAAAYGWRKEQMTKNAEAIGALGKELYDRVSVWAKYINEIGAALGKATDSYNKAVGSLESRLLPSIRKFKELGTTGAEEITELKKTEQLPRTLDLLE